MFATGCGGDSHVAPKDESRPDAAAAGAGGGSGDGGSGASGGSVAVDAGCRQLGEGPLRINELMADNDGVSIDENLETDDWIEIINTGSTVVNLADFWISDRSNTSYGLPSAELDSGEVIVLWADNELSQGPMHLPFKLTSAGESLFLLSDPCTIIDEVTFPALPENESFARLPDGHGAFAQCRYATPDSVNGSSCTPPLPPELPIDVVFDDYD